MTITSQWLCDVRVTKAIDFEAIFVFVSYRNNSFIIQFMQCDHHAKGRKHAVYITTTGEPAAGPLKEEQ